MNTNDKIKEYIKKEKARKNKLYCKEYYKLNKDHFRKIPAFPLSTPLGVGSAASWNYTLRC